MAASGLCRAAGRHAAAVIAWNFCPLAQACSAWRRQCSAASARSAGISRRASPSAASFSNTSAMNSSSSPTRVSSAAARSCERPRSALSSRTSARSASTVSTSCATIACTCGGSAPCCAGAAKSPCAAASAASPSPPEHSPTSSTATARRRQGTWHIPMLPSDARFRPPGSPAAGGVRRTGGATHQNRPRSPIGEMSRRAVVAAWLCRGLLDLVRACPRCCSNDGWRQALCSTAQAAADRLGADAPVCSPSAFD